MILQYGSSAYFLYLLASAIILAWLYFFFRKRSLRAKNWLLGTLALFNVLQHLLKGYLYPHLYGTGFGLQNTAYNVCAALILLSPLALLGKDGFFRVFISYAGTAAGALALLLPRWFLGQTIFQWEFLRFYVCHFILLLTSALPLLWKIRKVKFRDFWKTGFAFLFLLGGILLNDVLYFMCDGKNAPEALFTFLQAQNPFQMIQPTEEFSALADLFATVTPKIFLPTAAHPYYTPVFWYAFPLYLIITALSLVFFPLGGGKRIPVPNPLSSEEFAEHATHAE